MSSQLKNLSSYNQDEVPSGEKEIFGIVVSEWNSQITDSLLEGAVSTLLKYDVDEKDIDLSADGVLVAKAVEILMTQVLAEGYIDVYKLSDLKSLSLYSEDLLNKDVLNTSPVSFIILKLSPISYQPKPSVVASKG